MAIFTAIAGVFSAVSAFIGGLGAVGAFVLKTAVGIGLNLLAQAIAGKPKDPTFSINGTLQSGGDLPRSFILGRTATAGSLVWVNTWGKDGDTPNAYLTQVIALSDLPVSSLDEVWVNGEKCTLGASTAWGYAINEYVKDGTQNLWVQFYDGTQTVADPFLTGTATNGQRFWAATRVGRGVAYAIVTAHVSGQMFSGIPSFKFVVSGLKLYDPSKDSTVGGSGSHRWSTPSTWGGDGDHLPAVQAYNLLRGLTYNGKWFYGLQGLAAARLPAANWIAQINKCRASINGAHGPEPTYRSGGEIQIEAPLASAIEAILTTCQGRISEIGGVYSIHVGAPDLPSASFTDGDILSTEEQSFTPFFGLADTINGISATYPSPADGWSAKTAPPLYRSDLEALHGNRRLMADVPLDFVPYAEQVQRLMKSALEEGQRARRHTLVLPPEFWPYAVPGEILSWTSERNGYVAKLFRVDGAADRANLDVMIDITEVDPSDYDWDSDVDFNEPVDGAVGPIRPQPQPIIDWYAEPATIKDNTGEDRRPAIKLMWDNTDGRLDDVIGIEFEVRLASTLQTIYGGRTDQPEVGALLISQGLVANVAYGVRGRYIPGSSRPVLWSDWLPVTTPNILISDITVYLEKLQKEVRDYLQDRQREFDEAFQRLEFLAANAGSANAEDIVQRQHFVKKLGDTSAEILRESQLRADGDEALASDLVLVRADVDGNSAAIASEATARANADSALATDLTLVNARVDNSNALIASEATARADADNALSTALTAVSAKADAGTAQGLMQWKAVSAPTGVSARFSLEGKATAGGVYRTGGMYMDILPDRARFTFLADQFIITNGAVNGTPFLYEGSVLKLAVAHIGTVTAGLLRSADSKVQFDLTNSRLLMSDNS
jgi:hypothetical protein